MNGKAKLGRRLGGELAKHNQLLGLQVGFLAQVGEGIEQQDYPLAWNGVAAHNPKQQQGAILRQTHQLASQGLVDRLPGIDNDLIGQRCHGQVVHACTGANAIG